jgi:ubiquinone biosynthesis protein COQ4
MNIPIQVAYHTLALGADFNANTDHVFKLFDTLADGLPSEIVEQESLKMIQANPGLKEMYESGDPKYITTPYDLEALNKLPEGTLGKMYATHMIEHNFDPEFYPHHGTSKPSLWLYDRAAKTHDIWHVASGFDTSAEGEVALNNFYLAQRPAADYAFINISGILSSLKSGNPDDIDKMTQAISLGYQKGKQASLFIGVKWEDMWERQLVEIRKDLNIR